MVFVVWPLTSCMFVFHLSIVLVFQWSVSCRIGFFFNKLLYFFKKKNRSVLYFTRSITIFSNTKDQIDQPTIKLHQPEHNYCRKNMPGQVPVVERKIVFQHSDTKVKESVENHLCLVRSISTAMQVNFDIIKIQLVFNPTILSVSANMWNFMSLIVFQLAFDMAKHFFS